MSILLAAASVAFPASFQESVALEPASLHPSTATFVLQAPDIQSVLKAFKTTGPAKLMADPELHAAVGRLMLGEGGEPVDPWALVMAEYDRAVQEGGVPPLLDYLYGMQSMSVSVDVAGSDMQAFLQGADDTEDLGFYMSQNLGLRFVVDFVNEETAEQVTQFLVGMANEQSPSGLELSAKPLAMPETAMGFGTAAVQVWSFAPSEAGGGVQPEAFDGSLRLVSGGKRLAFSGGNVELSDFVSALSSGSMPSAATSLFADGRAAFTKAPETPVIELYLRPFAEDLVMAEEPAALPLLDVAEFLIGPAASIGIRGGHWRMGIDGGQFLTQGVHDPSKGGPMSGVIGADPLTPDALALVHPGALVTSVASLDPAVLTKMIRDMAEAEGDDALSALEENYGLRPDRDLAGSLGSALSYSLMPVKALFSAPNLMGAALLTDKAAFTNGMDGLVRFAEDFSGDDFLFVRDEIKSRSKDKTKRESKLTYTLSYVGELGPPLNALPFNLASLVKPTVTIMDDRVLLTTSKTHARGEISRVRKVAKSGEPAPVHEMISAMGGLGGATAVGYSDWPTFLGNLYRMARGMAPLLAAGAGDSLPFDIAMLPEASVLTRHFRPSENWTRMKDGKVMQYATSSLGMEALIVPLVSAGSFGYLSSSQAAVPSAVRATVPDEGSEVREATVSPDDGPTAEGAEVRVTNAALMEVDVAITIYQLDHSGAAPASLAALTLESANYPDGYLKGATLPVDGWSRALVYGKTNSGYKLYSMGPNGKDDGGGDDDISSQ